MREQIQKAVERAVKELFSVDLRIDLTRPEEKFGDFSTNVALQLAGQLKQNPTDLAEKIAEYLRRELAEEIDRVVLANNFINIRLKDEAVLKAAKGASNYRPSIYQGKVVVAEYSDPNPFKILHAGHLYTSVVGDSIACLLENAGATVHRVNFGGDVGLHVAKTLWAILSSARDENSMDVEKAWEDVKNYGTKSLVEKANWVTEHYVQGNNLYTEDSEDIRQAIAELNKEIYQVVNSNDHDSTLAQIYWTCRQWSYDYFEAFYREIEVTPFEKYYPESQTAPLGLKTVREQLKAGVFQESKGAVVFDGEKYGLHTRVFINSQGLPTYEAKDVGLIMLKWKDFHFDRSLVITGNDIIEYMKVVLKSLEQFEPELAKNSIHLTHGIVKLKGGEKMSSRKGNILRADALLKATAQASRSQVGKESKETTLGAVKYALLKHRLGVDIIYDPGESVSLVGNSGPYLQYAHARARSILGKQKGSVTASESDLEPAERSLARKVGEYPDVIDRAVNEFMPHHICNFIYELAQAFNSFYENNRVSGHAREGIRRELVKAYADTLKKGLTVLNISAPDHL